MEGRREDAEGVGTGWGAIMERKGGWPAAMGGVLKNTITVSTQGAAEGMQLETLELDESMRGDDGVKGDVRDVLHEAVGVRPTQCAQWVHCALKGAKTRECDRDGRWSAARSAAQDNSKHRQQREK